MSVLVAKVAEAAGIPVENIVDSENNIKVSKDTMADAIHPNLHGYGILALELYMKLAFSP